MELNKGKIDNANEEINKRLPLFYLVTVLFWISIYTGVPYVAPYAEYMQADLRFTGLIVGAYGFVQMVIRFPLGIISDRIGKRKIFILMGLFFAGISGLVVYFFPNPGALLASRSFAGITAATWVPLTILGSSYYRQEDTVRAVGYLNAANGFGRMAALLVGGFVAQALGFSYAFLLGGVVGLLGLILGFGMVEKSSDLTKSPKVTEPPSIATLLDVAKNPQLLCASILAILGMFIQFATAFGFTPMVADHMGANSVQLGLLGMVATVPALFISPFMGKAVKKFGLIAVLGLGFAFSGIGTALVAICQNLVQLFVVQFVSSIGLSALMTVLMGLSIRDISSECRATAMGFFQAVYGLGMFLGPFAIGWISHSFGLASAFMFTGAIGLVGIAMTIIFVKRGHLCG